MSAQTLRSPLDASPRDGTGAEPGELLAAIAPTNMTAPDTRHDSATEHPPRTSARPASARPASPQASRAPLGAITRTRPPCPPTWQQVPRAPIDRHATSCMLSSRVACDRSTTSVMPPYPALAQARAKVSMSMGCPLLVEDACARRTPCPLLVEDQSDRSASCVHRELTYPLPSVGPRAGRSYPAQRETWRLC